MFRTCALKLISFGFDKTAWYKAIQLGTEWEHMKNQSPLWADGSSLWQGQRTWTQPCYSCAMLRKLGPGCFGVWFFLSYFSSYKKVTTSHKYRHTYYLKLQASLLFQLLLDWKPAVLEDIHPTFITLGSQIIRCHFLSPSQMENKGTRSNCRDMFSWLLCCRSALLLSSGSASESRG